MTPKPDYSTYTLQQLFVARQWSDDDGNPHRKRWLEDEIQKRCAHLQDAASHKGPTSSGPATRFRPWGLIFGVLSLGVSVGPMLVSDLLDTVGLIDGDRVLFLLNLWVLLTLPIAATGSLIGGIKDVDRVGKWFHRQMGSEIDAETSSRQQPEQLRVSEEAEGLVELSTSDARVSPRIQQDNV